MKMKFWMMFFKIIQPNYDQPFLKFCFWTVTLQTI
jgi:hypothetical protein